MQTRTSSGMARGVGILVVGMLAAGALAAGPATGAVDRLSKREKKQGDKRWINVGEKASDADKLDGLDSTAFLGANAKAADADKLDGLDSTAFLGANAKAADADKLDGLDSAGFVQIGSAAGGDLTGAYPNPQLAPREAVQTPTLLTCDGVNDWSTNVALAKPVGFWKDRSGVVHLQGAVSCSGNATEGGTIFNLPSGYRPAFGQGVVRWAALAGGPSIAQIAVLDSGGFPVVYDGPDSTAADDYISLDGLTFRAEG